MTTVPGTVHPAESAAQLSAGTIDLVDVRTPAEFRAVHAVGARLVPLAGLDPAALAGGRPVHLICQSSARAQQAADRCRAAGVAVTVVEGGTAAWIAAGLPIERGAATFSVERQTRIAIGAGVVAGAALAWTVHPAWIALSACFGAGLILAGITDRCPLAALIAIMPWNRCDAPAASCCQPMRNT